MTHHRLGLDDQEQRDREDRSARCYLVPGTRFRARGGERVYPRARRKNAEEVTAASVVATAAATATTTVAAAAATTVVATAVTTAAATATGTGAHTSRFY